MEEGPVADQMHDNETEISDFALTLRLFTVVRFSRVRATKGPYGGKKNSGAKKKKGGKHLTKRCSPLPGKQAEGERLGFSAPIIVTFGVTERIH